MSYPTPAEGAREAIEIVRDIDVPRGAWPWIEEIGLALDGPHKRIETPKDHETIVLWHNEQPVAFVLNLRDQFNRSIQFRVNLALLISRPDGVASVDRIERGHVCEHGIRWPHACQPCDDAAWQRQTLTAAPSESVGDFARVTEARNKLTPEYLTMTPLRKWQTLAAHGLLGTDEPWIADMAETLRQFEVAPKSGEVGELREAQARALLAQSYREADFHEAADAFERTGSAGWLTTDVVLRAITAALAKAPPTNGGEIASAVRYAADIRWQELAQGSPFTVIDRQMLGELHALGTAALSALALTTEKE